MRSKRTRDDNTASVAVTPLTTEDHILREAAQLTASSDFSGSIPTSPTSVSRPRVDTEAIGLLERFSLQVVSSLQGSTNLNDAQATAREVLVDFLKEAEVEATEARVRADKYLAANKILGRALLIMKDKLGVSQRELSETTARLGAAEDRARQAEHTAEVLRWHLQHDRASGSIKGPRDIF